MGREAIAKGASILLGPTVNMQRSPLGGRGFESFAEDPTLAGAIAASSVNGIQSTGVAASLKHFVCNDLEDKRMSSNSIVTERALREVYLLPFQIAQRDARPATFMTAYNLLNGLHCSENPRLLKSILREEWGFDGLVMSDWFGTYSTSEALKAGLDLEMPGPSRLRGTQIETALRSGKLLDHQLDERVKEVLKLVKRVSSLGIPERAEETNVDSPETAALLRKLSSNSIVLLKNEHQTLPFSKHKTTAVIGPNAEIAAYCGGGSASLLPYYAISPLDGIKTQASDVKYSLGAPGWKKLPLISRLAKLEDGKPGIQMKCYLEPHGESNRTQIDDFTVDSSIVYLFDYKNPKLDGTLFYADFDFYITPDATQTYQFSCSCAGTALLYVDDQLVIDNKTKQTRGDSFMRMGTVEELGEMALTAGTRYHVRVEFGSQPTMPDASSASLGTGGIRLGFYGKLDLPHELASAVAVAKSVDQVVLCVGLNFEWESESFDRAHMDLPPGNDALVAAVLAANPNAVVVNQSGTPVTMPWAGEARAVVHAWYGGNETGNAIADVLFGEVNPSGKLSLSWPRRVEDNPAWLTYRSDGNRVLYGEDVWVGYRWYEATRREVEFAFGHGLSYTRFGYEAVAVKAAAEEDGVRVEVTLRNDGGREGAEVVQVYVAPCTPSIQRPIKELKGFAKVVLAAGETKTVEVKLSRKYATSFYCELRDAWVSEKGKYRVLVGGSSASTPIEAELEVEKTLVWKGL